MNIKPLYKKESYKTKEEWLPHRGLGGTSAGVILGHSQYMTPIKLWKSIVYPSGQKYVDKTTESQEFGIASEPLIRKVFALNFPQYKVHTPKQFEMFRRVDKPYLTATLDGRLLEIETGRKLILEIKTCDIRSKNDLEEWERHLPQKYYDQVIHYLMVLNDYDGVHLVAQLKYYDFFAPVENKIKKLETRFYYIDRQEKLADIEALEKIETRFWEYNVIKRIPPSIEIKL